MITVTHKHLNSKRYLCHIYTYHIYIHIKRKRKREREKEREMENMQVHNAFACTRMLPREAASIRVYAYTSNCIRMHRFLCASMDASVTSPCFSIWHMSCESNTTSIKTAHIEKVSFCIYGETNREGPRLYKEPTQIL